MAIVSIRIRDEGDDDDVNVVIEADPSIPMRDGKPVWDELTAAQVVGLAMVKSAMEQER